MLTGYLVATEGISDFGGDGVTRGCAVTAEKSADGELLLTWQGGVELPDMQQYVIFVNDHTVLSRIHPPTHGRYGDHYSQSIRVPGYRGRHLPRWQAGDDLQ